MSITTRLITFEDVPLLTELVLVNRDFMAPWEPTRPDDYFTVEGQGEIIRAALERHSVATIPGDRHLSITQDGAESSLATYDPCRGADGDHAHQTLA